VERNETVGMREREKLDKYGPHCYMSIEEADTLYDEIVYMHKKHLAKYDVHMPKRTSYQALQLVYLYKYREYLVHRDTISEFVRQVFKDASKDQQTRHLAGKGWYILLKGEEIPGTNGKKMESGYHHFYDITIPKPTFMLEKLKRLGRMAAGTFEELVVVYDNKCATCGAEQGKSHPRYNEKIVVLQKGHMHPRKSLNLDNTIPQCQICNQTYQNNFIFDENGHVKSVYNPEFILRCDSDVKKKIFDLLKKEFA
jgi:hypothetical protein